MQVGNTTGVQQPAGTNGDYLLMAQDSGFGNGAFLTGMPLSSANVTGPLKINFDMFKGSPGSRSWTSFTLRSGFNAWPVAGSGELGFLYQSNSGIQIFNNGGGIGGFTSTTGGDSFAFYLTDRTGTGSPFTSDLTRVVITQGAAIVGSYTLNTGMTGSRYLAFGVLSGIVGGVDNLAVTPMQSNILPATTDLSLTAATSALQLENVTQTVTTFDGVAGSTVSMGPLSRLIVTGSAGSTFEGTLTGAAGGITKMGSDTLALTGTSSYGGTTIFAGGIVNVASLSDFGVDSSLGNRAADAGGDVGLLFRGGTLQYTGSTPRAPTAGFASAPLAAAPPSTPRAATRQPRSALQRLLRRTSSNSAVPAA